MLSFSRRTKRSSVGTLYSAEYANFSANFQVDINYHFAEKPSAPKLDDTLKYKLCYQNFLGFYILCQQKNTQNVFSIKTTKVEPGVILNEVFDTSLKEEFRSCQHFFIDSELNWEGHKFFSIAQKTSTQQ